MGRDQLVGWGLLALSVVVVVVYAYILFLTPYSSLLIQITLMVAVAGVFGILGWIGYTLATTPPPKPIEEIEKEIEAELKKLEENTGKDNASESKPSA
ncbi:transcriptional regulator [Desulfurococcus mucosus]|uniref:HTH DNA binding domain protein n=1 Tax=Desulfurococcus mucosus (strain ATCC 35584 / DSM 2162 / JCM 9187 / O7/1) TaxID=765177 RepID=E8R9R1_DESM0|nr:transcriptional regulator [Desulfurococcus mucosus]ADV65237.1 HTH DNA binding domain protein [Desulfurococcus mucosus DSM 2162]